MRDAISRHSASSVADGLTRTTHDIDHGSAERHRCARETCAARGPRHIRSKGEPPMLLSTGADHRRGRPVRDLACSSRTLSDDEDQAVHLADLPLSDPKIAVHTLALLLAGEPVEVFAVAC